MRLRLAVLALLIVPSVYICEITTKHTRYLFACGSHSRLRLRLLPLLNDLMTQRMEWVEFLCWNIPDTQYQVSFFSMYRNGRTCRYIETWKSSIRDGICIIGHSKQPGLLLLPYTKSVQGCVLELMVQMSGVALTRAHHWDNRNWLHAFLRTVRSF